MSGAIVFRGICYILLLVSIISLRIPANLPDSTTQNLEPFVTEYSSSETPLPNFSFHQIHYEQLVNESSFSAIEEGSCTLQIFCRPTGAIKPSLHCYIITNDNRQQSPVTAKFTAGPDPKRRGNIASWKIEPVKDLIKDIPCVQCIETNQIPCLKIDCLRSLTKEFNESRLRYDFRAKRGPNSNSFVTGLLRKCGVEYSTVNFAAGANGYEYVFN
jgi:hypothetical protein